MDDIFIKRLIIEFTRNGNRLSGAQLKQIKGLLGKIKTIRNEDCFDIMSIATMLSYKRKPVKDESNVDALCFYYCVLEPTHCPTLIENGIVNNMCDFFTHVKDYCIDILKEEE